MRRKNLTQLEFQAQNTLKRNPDKIITPADKVGPFLIMDKQDYVNVVQDNYQISISIRIPTKLTRGSHAQNKHTCTRHVQQGLDNRLNSNQ